MKKPSIRLWMYERKFFFAGEEIRGLCRMSPIRIIDIVKPIHIRLKGLITATSPDNSATFERECLRMDCYIDADTGYEKRPDVYYYDFNFQLPYALPPTINSPIADTTITYTLKVELELQHGLRTTESLQSELDINVRKVIHIHDPQYLVPLERSFESSASGCCFSTGNYSVDVKLERTGYSLDEAVMLSVRFQNQTNRRAKPYLTLIQKARNPYCLDFEEFEFPLSAADHSSALPARSERQWTNLVVRIPPECTESFSYPEEQPFFKVHYFIEIGLLGSFGKGGARLPIEIGTAPFHRNVVSLTESAPGPSDSRATIKALISGTSSKSGSLDKLNSGSTSGRVSTSTKYVRAARRRRRQRSADLENSDRHSRLSDF